MKVKELIAKLQEFDEEKEVYVLGDAEVKDYSFTWGIDNVFEDDTGTIFID